MPTEVSLDQRERDYAAAEFRAEEMAAAYLEARAAGHDIGPDGLLTGLRLAYPGQDITIEWDEPQPVASAGGQHDDGGERV